MWSELVGGTRFVKDEIVGCQDCFFGEGGGGMGSWELGVGSWDLGKRERETETKVLTLNPSRNRCTSTSSSSQFIPFQGEVSSSG